MNIDLNKLKNDNFDPNTLNLRAVGPRVYELLRGDVEHFTAFDYGVGVKAYTSSTVVDDVVVTIMVEFKRPTMLHGREVSERLTFTTPNGLQFTTDYSVLSEESVRRYFNHDKRVCALAETARVACEDDGEQYVAMADEYNELTGFNFTAVRRELPGGGFVHAYCDMRSTLNSSPTKNLQSVNVTVNNVETDADLLTILEAIGDARDEFNGDGRRPSISEYAARPRHYIANSYADADHLVLDDTIFVDVNGKMTSLSLRQVTIGDGLNNGLYIRLNNLIKQYRAIVDKRLGTLAQLSNL